MFDRDKWQEIFGTISQNKLRTFLTAFSVAWGIFILIVLLGAGQAFRNSAQDQFMSDAINSLYIEGGQTSTAYDGFKPGRKIELTNADYDLVKSKIHTIDNTSAAFDVRKNATLKYKNETASYTIRGCLPEHGFLERVALLQGRFINQIDIAEYRKVCVLGVPVKEVLFKDEDPMNKFIEVAGIPFKVVGVFKDPSDRDNNRIYIPLSTAQRAYNGKYLDVLWATIDDKAVGKSEAVVEQAREVLAKKYHFDPKDLNAVKIYNSALDYIRVMNLMDGIKIFIWVIGIFTLIAGIVGVSNIMMIIVKERTREIGIRKAIGASPSSIVMLIVQESIFITGVAGYIGLVLGVGVLELLNKLGVEGDFFKRPQVNFSVAISATVLIIVAGGLAGLFPALRAAKVEPVEALRSE
ncbi:MAG: ABC transporter permease [Bacteroidia bacterium]